MRPNLVGLEPIWLWVAVGNKKNKQILKLVLVLVPLAISDA